MNHAAFNEHFFVTASSDSTTQVWYTPTLLVNSKHPDAINQLLFIRLAEYLQQQDQHINIAESEHLQTIFNTFNTEQQQILKKIFGILN